MAIDIQEMKRRLETRRAELIESLGDLTEVHPKVVDSDEASDDFQDIGDGAVDVQERDQEQSIAANNRALLTEVEEALKRIEDGTYGRCVVCGQLIPEKRLEAMPWASLCVKDEEKIEQRNLSNADLHSHDRDTHYA